MEILLHLFEHVVLETDDGTLIDEVVGGVVEKADGDGIATGVVPFLFQLGDVELGYSGTPAVHEHNRRENQGRHDKE